MSAVPKRPPRPSRPKSCHADTTAICSSAAAVDGTDVASSNDGVNHQCVTAENVSTGSRVSVNCDVLDTEVIGTVKEATASGQSEDSVTDMSTAELQTNRSRTKQEVQEPRNTDVAKNVTAVKPEGAIHMVSTEVKFKCSPKTRKAPPVPPPPTLQSKESKPLSADGEKSLDELPVKGDNGDSENERPRTVLRDLSPCNKSASTSSSSTTVANSMYSKPALKPKPVTTIARESVSSQDTSSLPGDDTGCSSEHLPSNVTTATTALPVYAVVNKSRTLRRTSNVDRDAGGGDKSAMKVTVARSKSAVAAGVMPPKKPPRTFAHSEYMQLKSLSLPRSSEVPSGSEEVDSVMKTSSADESTATDSVTKTNEDKVDGGDKVRRQTDEGTELVAKHGECSVDGDGKEPAAKTREDYLDASGKVKRRQTDKLPAPPRPPPPSFPDNRSTSLSSRSSVVDVDSAAGDHGDSKCSRPQRSSLVLEEKQKTYIRPDSESDAADDDDSIYAVPGEVTSDGAKCNSDASHGAATARSRLSSTNSAASETTQLSLHPVRAGVAVFVFCLL